MKTLKFLSALCLLFFFSYAKAQLTHCPSRIGKTEWLLKSNAKYTEFIRFTSDGKRMINREYTANTQFNTGLKTAEFVFGDDHYCDYCYYEYSDIKYLDLILNDINSDLMDFRSTANQNEWQNVNGHYLLNIITDYVANSFTVAYKADN